MIFMVEKYLDAEPQKGMSERTKLEVYLDLATGIMERTQGFTIIPSGSLTLATDFIRDYEEIRSSIGDEIPKDVLRGYDKQIVNAKIYFGVDI